MQNHVTKTTASKQKREPDSQSALPAVVQRLDKPLIRRRELPRRRVDEALAVGVEICGERRLRGRRRPGPRERRRIGVLRGVGHGC